MAREPKDRAEEMGDEALSEYEAHQIYDDMLDEVYGTTEIAGMEYQTSRALRELDPVAYRCGFSDWISSEIEDGNITVGDWY